MPVKEFIGYHPSSLKDVQRRLVEVGASPNEEIGQHFLVNREAIDFLAQTVNPGSVIIEIGCGVGHLTERLAQKASRLVGIEIDRRYQPLLDQIITKHDNVSITYADALRVDFNRLLAGERGEGQIVASLPYHITEPLIQRVAPLRLASLTLVVGRRYADSIAASSDSRNWGRLSILTATFFDSETLTNVSKDCFFPVPRTDSAIVQLSPRDEREVGSNRRDAIFRHLFLTSRRNSTLRKGLKEGFDQFEQSKYAGLTKRERNRKSRSSTRLRLREIAEEVNMGKSDFNDRDSATSAADISALSRDAINRLDIPALALDKPFSLLNNTELRMLYEALG